MEEKVEIVISKVNTKLMINSMLLGAMVSMFFLVASLQPEIFKENYLLSIQMVLAIPFFVTACISSTYMGKKINKKLWYNFGWFTFIVGYAFTLNSIGIIISTITSIWIGVIFFASSITLSLSYTLFLVILEDKNPRERIVKDIFFIILLFGFGVIAIL